MAREPWRSFYATKAWQDSRSARLELDEFRCTYKEGPRRCSVRLGDRDQHGDLIPVDVHHITALSDGGDPYDLENLRTLCRPHHGKVPARRRSRRQW
jgi:5-methylcytosine-specific restriction endonuclease McrA